jgi:hypothetical protein
MKNEIQTIELVIVAIGLCSLFVMVGEDISMIGLLQMCFCLSVLGFIGDICLPNFTRILLLLRQR